MTVNAAGLAALAAAAVLLLVALRGRRRPGALRNGLSGAVVLGALALGLVWAGSSRGRASSRADLLAAVPDGMPEQGFVGSQACQACHPSQYGSWHDSYHSSMTELAEPDAVLGDFHGMLISGHRTYRLWTEGDEYWVEMLDPAWEKRMLDDGIDPNSVPAPPQVKRRIVMTTGSHHMQTYWVGSETDGSLYNFPFIWLIADQRWVPLEAVFLRPPQWPRQYVWWQSNCITCHSVAGEEGHDEESRTYQPRVGELGIACEACHGPARDHVLANQDPERRYRLHLGGADDSTIVNPSKLSARSSTQICAQCHDMFVYRNAERSAGRRYRAGGNLWETHISVRATEEMPDYERADWPDLKSYISQQSPMYLSNRFWPDGMCRVSGRDANAMTRSACYIKGDISCLSCHSMHESDPNDQLALPEESNEACFQCHEPYRDKLVEHTHHLAASSGSLCYNCHMPHTTYGLMKAIRSHVISNPTAKESVETGRPNACNLCHLNETLRWTADKLTEWYGQPDVELSEDQESLSAIVSWTLAGDAGQRALMAWHMGWKPALAISGENWVAPYLGHLLDDPYATVRYIAQRSLRRQPGFGDLRFDYMCAENVRVDARREAMERWESDWTGGATGPSLLIGPSGGLLAADFERLLATRDDRLMDLRE